MKKVIKIFLFLFLVAIKTYANDYFDYYDIKVQGFGRCNFENKTFFITSGMELVSDSDPEFKEYASWVSSALKLNGAIEVQEINDADLCVLISYDMTDKSYYEKVPKPIYGKTGVNSARTTYSIDYKGDLQSNTSISYNYGITGVYYEENKINEFLKILNIYIYENKDEAKMLTKANISTKGKNNNLRSIIPILSYIAGFYIDSPNDYDTRLFPKIDEEYKQFHNKTLTKYKVYNGYRSYRGVWSSNKKTNNSRQQHIYATFLTDNSISLLLYAHKKKTISLYTIDNLTFCEGVDYYREFEKYKYFLNVDGKEYPCSSTVYSVQDLYIKFNIDVRKASRIQLVKKNKKGKIKDYWEVIKL